MNRSRSQLIRDVVVIGAGPAGSIAARELARRGNDVLLVESRSFPRWKVCGCCLGSLALRTLDEIGLADRIPGWGGRPVVRTHVHWKGRQRTASGGAMIVLSRESLDSGLANTAEIEGANVLWNTRARIEHSGDATQNAHITLDTCGIKAQISARAVVLAAGLHSSLTDPTARPICSVRSHIGLGLIQRTPPKWLAQGELTMFLGQHGYAGCILTESGDVTWAAAVSPAAIKDAGSPGECVAQILNEAGVDGKAIDYERWQGTRLLTQTIDAQSGRIYRVGDAAGYVEPITGEGMSWAIASGARAAGVIHSALKSGTEHQPGTWEAASNRLLRRRKNRCTVVAAAIRRPLVLTPAFALAGVSDRLSAMTFSRAIGTVRALGHVR